MQRINLQPRSPRPSKPSVAIKDRSRLIMNCRLGFCSSNSVIPFSFAVGVMKPSATGGGICLLLIWLLQFSHHVKAQGSYVTVCNNTKNYTSGGAYQRNLNLTIDSVVANASLTWYYTTVNGQQPDASYGLIQCVAETSSENCRACAVNASATVRRECPRQVQASIVFEVCTVQYSDTLFFSVSDTSPRFYITNGQSASDQELFNNGVQNLLGNISSEAAANTSRLAFGSSSLSDSVSLYAMAQCTKDIIGNDCLACLQNVITNIPKNGGTKIGARGFAVSCYVRYEKYSFFDESLLPPSPPPPPPSPPPPPPLLAPSPEATTSSTRQKGESNKTVLYVVIPMAVVAVVASLLCGCFFWRRASRKRVDTENNSRYDFGSLHNETSENERRKVLLIVPLNTLKRATKSFSDSCKLGEGGFGSVYKGILCGGREIAVKRLSSSSKQGLEELKTEVTLVAKLMHRNLVRLLGFCLEEEEKLLVYEYLPNGSLDRILFDQNKRSNLDWERRYNIIVGLARGLLYLHEDSQLRVIHRDLKASNVLLDADMNPKISDFGLARLFPGSQTQGNTSRIAGTYGYMAPEYVKLGHFSTKSDVYSLGILVIEIVTGRKNSSFKSTNLSSFAWEHWSNGTALDLVDPVMGDQWSRNEVLKCIQIALMCVQEAAADRPTMSEVIMMFSSYTVTIPSLSKPAFYVWTESVESSGSNSTHKCAAAISQPRNSSTMEQSINEVTITDLDAR